jgi:hypothetical protein
MPMTHMTQSMQWHKYRTQDPGLLWLRGLLKQAVQRMDADIGRADSRIDKKHWSPAAWRA